MIGTYNIGTALAAGFILGGVFVFAAIPPQTKMIEHRYSITSSVRTLDPFSQSNFPCAEDEALVYAPQFGPDRVGCMAVDGGLAPEVWETPADLTAWCDAMIAAQAINLAVSYQGLATPRLPMACEE